MLYFALKYFDSQGYHCTKEHCIRFCCLDSQNCNEKFIEEHFNKSWIPSISGDFHIKYGKPSCFLDVLNNDLGWQFTKVSKRKMCPKGT